MIQKKKRKKKDRVRGTLQLEEIQVKKEHLLGKIYHPFIVNLTYTVIQTWIGAYYMYNYLSANLSTSVYGTMYYFYQVIDEHLLFPPLSFRG